MKQNSQSALRLARKAIPWTFYALIAAFLIIYVRETDFSRLEGLQVSIIYAVPATMLAIAFRYWGAYIWFVLLEELGAKRLREHYIQLLYVYSKAWLGRYVPGTAPWILGRIYFASQHGVSKHKLAVSSLLEAALQIVVALALAFLLLILDPRLEIIGIRMKWLMGVVMAGCVIAMTPAVFNRLLSLCYRLVRKPGLEGEQLVSNKMIRRGVILYFLGSIINGVAWFLIAKAVYVELGISDLAFVVGACSLASAAGMLVIFVPSGIGVREGVQVLLLSAIMPIEVALIIAVTMRIWSVAVDFVFFGISHTLAHIR